MTPGRNATVIGAGPAGLMAAEVLARSGLAVTVFEHMASPGRKLILAGRGGLNITHSEPIEVFVGRYGTARSRLEAALAVFSPDDLQAWCSGLDGPTVVGSSGRVFPQSFRATPLLRAWLARLESLGVELVLRHRWLGFGNDGARSLFRSLDGRTLEIHADVTVMALGGASWPRVGSDGGWAEEFVRRGVAVSPLRAANCGVTVQWSPDFVGRFAGVPLKNVAVAVSEDSVRGDVMITRLGLEGGPIYAHSAAIRSDLDNEQRGRLVIDLYPDLTVAKLQDRLAQRRRPKDSISTWLRRSGLDRAAAALVRQAMGDRIPKEAQALSEILKALPLPVTSMMPIERAISTAGGVCLDELDDSFMLRRIPGVFVAGEMLDWEAPTGGYLLQASFSTAVVAANGAMAWLGQPPDSDT